MIYTLYSAAAIISDGSMRNYEEEPSNRHGGMVCNRSGKDYWKMRLTRRNFIISSSMGVLSTMVAPSFGSEPSRDLKGEEIW